MVQNVFPQDKIKVFTEPRSLWRIQETMNPFASSSFWKPPALTLGPFFNLQRTWSNAFCDHQAPLSSESPLEDFLRTVLATSGYLLHLKIFTFITSAKPPFATEGKIQVWELDRDILGRSLCNKTYWDFWGESKLASAKLHSTSTKLSRAPTWTILQNF